MKMNKKLIHGIAFFIGFISGVVSITGYVEYFYKEKIVPRFFPWIDVQELPYKIPSNQHIICGKYGGGEEDLKVRVYIWPDDGLDRYWLQMPNLNYAYKKKWAELCYFGNPQRIDHKKIDPTFYVYAVLVKASCVDSLPGAKSMCPWIFAAGPKAFIDSIKKIPGVRAISNACAVTRTNFTCPEIKIISPSFNQNINPPVICHWEPDGTMYIELFNSGCKIYEGYLANNSRIPYFVDPTNIASIRSSSPNYLIMISETKGNECQASTWFRVIR